MTGATRRNIFSVSVWRLHHFSTGDSEVTVRKEDGAGSLWEGGGGVGRRVIILMKEIPCRHWTGPSNLKHDLLSAVINGAIPAAPNKPDCLDCASNRDSNLAFFGEWVCVDTVNVRISLVWTLKKRAVPQIARNIFAV